MKCDTCKYLTIKGNAERKKGAGPMITMYYQCKEGQLAPIEMTDEIHVFEEIKCSKWEKKEFAQLLNNLKMDYPNKEFEITGNSIVVREEIMTTITLDKSIYDLEVFHGLNVEKEIYKLIKTELG